MNKSTLALFVLLSLAPQILHAAVANRLLTQPPACFLGGALAARS
jgi:hypothetical protein